jgi:tRNA pseudouridine55 synthase
MSKTLPNGFKLINKPAGITSFDVVSKIKKEINESINNASEKIKKEKVGHAGTLDPFATGLLIIAIGRNATKRISKFQKLDKEYLATILLGFATDTDDLTGVPISKKVSLYGIENIHKTKNMNTDIEKKIEKTIKSFIGKNKQIPSTVSAKKINGQRAYKLHRQGKSVKLNPSTIEIYDIQIKKITKQSDGTAKVNIIVKCSTGTYIRALARDIGKKLGVGGHLISLKRTKIGPYSLNHIQ